MSLSDTQRIDELERIVTELQTVIGDYKNPIDLSNKPSELPNKEYPVMYRQAQLGAAVNSAVAKVDKITSTDPNIPIVVSSPDGVSILFIADTDFSAPQRKDDNGNPTRYKQIAGIGLSEDGGFRRFQNVVWPGNGQRAYIADPTRLGVVMGFDRLGNESLTYYYAGTEFEPGKFEVKEFAKGQQMVFVRGDNGKDISIFLPQPGAVLRKELCTSTVNVVTVNEPL